VRVHARHAVSASCLFCEIRAHAENFDEALHHLAKSFSVRQHMYSALHVGPHDTLILLFYLRFSDAACAGSGKYYLSHPGKPHSIAVAGRAVFDCN
jgi:hypothetical protein